MLLSLSFFTVFILADRRVQPGVDRAEPFRDGRPQVRLPEAARGDQGGLTRFLSLYLSLSCTLFFFL